METIDSVLTSAGWVWHEPKSNNVVFNILLDNKAAIVFASGVHIELGQADWRVLGAATTALGNGLIAEGIPIKGATTKEGVDTHANPNAIHIVIGRRE
jgi:hypothetical protein